MNNNEPQNEPQIENPVEGSEGATPATPKTPEPEGSPATSWIDSLGDDLKDNASLKKYKDLPSFAKSHLELVKKLGEQGKLPPAEDATDEEKSAWIAKQRGIDSIDKYSYKITGDDADVLQESVAAISKGLFDAGANDTQHSAVMGKLVDMFRANQAQQAEAQAEAFAKAEATLRKEWGEDYDLNVKSIDAFTKKFPEAREIFESEGLLKNPAVARMMHALTGLAEDKPVAVHRAVEKTLDAEIRELENSPAFKNEWHDGHEAAVNRHVALIMKKAEL